MATLHTVVITVTVRIEIDVPAEDGFAYVSDFSKNVEWQSGITSTDWISNPPIRVGSTYRQVAEYKDTETIYEVTSIEPGRSITTESRQGATFPVTVTRTVDSLGESRCRITVDLIGHPRGFRRIMQPYVERVVRKSVEADYRRLKRHLESDDQDT
jgi:uncharacterized membrane protein